MLTSTPPIEFVSKGWGFEKIIVNNNLYCGKLLYLAKGKRCSVHVHHIKDETFFLHRGKIELLYGNEKEVEEVCKLHGKSAIIDTLDKVILSQGDTFYIPPGRVHQMIALEDSELFEFSTTDFPEDSIRLIKGD